MRKKGKHAVKKALVLIITLLLFPRLARSQTVIPAADDTQTQVTSDGNRFSISGGQLSQDGMNLFHSFQEFGLSENQIANFLSNPTIQNILTRVVGGNPSLINGLIQVTGGHSNLFIINPAGIIFGTNARLDVPAAFLAATASGIGFGNQWFYATGVNDYTHLVGTPNGFVFATTPGTLVNGGQLAVNPGETLTLLGGTVINTGTLQGPGGMITVAAVPGESLVRISQIGHLLSLEVTPREIAATGKPEATVAAAPGSGSIYPLSLPELLTGKGMSNMAMGVSVNPLGQVILTGSSAVISEQPGTAIISGTVDVTNTIANPPAAVLHPEPDSLAAGPFDLSDRQNQQSINLLGNRVGVIDATLNASGISGGGIIRIGGDFQGAGVVPNASQTLVNRNSVIHADALAGGNGGRVIIWGNDATQFYGTVTVRGASPLPNSPFSLPSHGGFVEISGQQSLTFQGAVDTQSPTGKTGTLLLDPAEIRIVSGSQDGNDADAASHSFLGDGGVTGQVLLGDAAPTLIYESELEGMAADTNLILESTGNIIIGDLADNTLALPTNRGHSITFNAKNFFLLDDFNDAIQTQGGDVTIMGRSIGVGGVDANGGNITLTGNGIDLLGGMSSVNSTGGTIQVQPILPERGIRLGATTDNPEILDLTIRDLSAIGQGFNGITIGRNDGRGQITVERPLTFNDPVRIQSPSGQIDINQPIQGVGNASLAFNAATINLNANVTTESQAITLGGNVFLNNDITLNTGTQVGEVIAQGSINGNHQLTVNTGTARLNDAIGNTTPLSRLQVNAKLTEISGNITTQPGDLILNSPVTINQAITLKAGDNFVIPNPDHVIQTQGENLKIIGSRITVGKVNANGGDLQLTGDDINLTGGTNSIRSLGGNLQLQPLTLNRGIRLGGVTESPEVLNLTTRNLSALQDGFNSITLGQGNSRSQLAIISPVTFSDPLILQSGAGNITVDAALTGIDNSAITLNAATIQLNNNITTPNQPITINGNVVLGNDATLNTGTDQGNILISGQINGNQRLTLNAGGGDVKIAGIIGSETPVNRLEIQAQNTILSGNIKTSSGGIAVQTQTLAAPGNLTTHQGDVNLDIDGEVNLSHISTNGGNITITSNTDALNAGILDSASMDSVDHNGGSITLKAAGNIGVSSINTQGSQQGRGGTLTITTPGFFQARDTFTDSEGILASLSTAGGISGGAITLQHGGGDVQQPFIVGDAATNGTQGSINAGKGNVISPPQAYNRSYTQGNSPNQINLITTGVPPSPVPSPVPNPIPSAAPSPVPSVVMEPEIPSSLVTDLEGVTTKRSDAIEFSFPFFALNLDAASNVLGFERGFSREYEKYLGLPARPPIQNISEVYETLRRNDAATGIKSALIYINFTGESESLDQPSLPDNQRSLTLVLTSTNNQVFRVSLPEVTRAKLLEVSRNFQNELINPRKRDSTEYLTVSQQLYQWLLAPLKQQLEALKIQNIVFIPAAGVRSLPYAALYDGKQFLIEQYSISIMPSLSLTDTRYDDVRNSEVLAMGASQFADKPPLYAVPVELSLIADNFWEGKSFLNEQFTLENLQRQHLSQRFRVIHLATHAEFLPGAAQNSYIQLWNSQIRLPQMQQLQWNDPLVELLVLSACSTALGDEKAELGFAGLAVNSGAKSVLASLWAVSDEGTLGLMAEFYRQLKSTSVKAIALQRAQIALLRNRVRIENGNLRLLDEQKEIPLPPQLANRSHRDLVHPYYWAAFTLIGNPW